MRDSHQRAERASERQRAHASEARGAERVSVGEGDSRDQRGREAPRAERGSVRGGTVTSEWTLSPERWTGTRGEAIARAGKKRLVIASIFEEPRALFMRLGTPPFRAPFRLSSVQEERESLGGAPWAGWCAPGDHQGPRSWLVGRARV